MFVLTNTSFRITTGVMSNTNETTPQKPNTIQRLRKLAAANPQRIVFPESQDPRVLAAAKTLVELKLAKPILIGGEEVDGTQRIDPTDESLIQQCSAQLFENRKHKGLTQEAARVALDDNLLLASLMVRLGHADGCVAGSIATTASVIRAGLYGVGTPATVDGKSVSKLVSSFFLMQLPDRCLTYSDAGVVPDPDQQQLAEIAVEAARNHELLTGETARVAMLSFSTKGSAHHDRVTKVQKATEIAKQLNPDLLIDGELQFDAAFVPEIAARKAADSKVAGRANVFVFPDLDSGNIAYKITERLGGAIALGPLVQGLAKPCMDLSRGCSADDIVDVAVVACVLAQTA